VKQIISYISSFFIFGIVSATENFQNFSPADTTIISDSAKHPNDPKKIFKELFVKKMDAS